MVDDTPPDPDRPTASMLDALSNQRRRRVLRCLRPSFAFTVEELARAVARRERAGGAAWSSRRRVHIDLYHCQLPRLAEAGLVRYEPVAGLVAITERGRRAEALIRGQSRAGRTAGAG